MKHLSRENVYVKGEYRGRRGVVATKVDLYHWQRELARRPRDATRLVVLLKDFSPIERGRLRFTRWLVATGRLAGRPKRG